MPRTIDLRNAPVAPPLDPTHELPPADSDIAGRDDADAPDAGEPDPDPPTGGAVFASWEAPEFDLNAEQKKSLLISGSVLLTFAVAAVFMRSYLFAVLLLLGGGLCIANAFRRPRMLPVAIAGSGVSVGEKVYEFAELKSFWISYNPPLFKELLLVSKKSLTPIIRIPLGDADPVEVRDAIRTSLPEEPYEEGLIDIIAKRMGF